MDSSPRHLKWGVIAAAFLATSALAAWVLSNLWYDSKQACGIAATLSDDASSLMAELDGIKGKPFLRYALMTHLGPERVTFERELSYSFLSRFSRFHVPSKFRYLTRQLNAWGEGQDPDARTAIVQALAEEGRNELKCPAPPEGKEHIDHFHSLAEQYLATDAPTDALRFEKSWNEDVQTYCRSVAVQNRLATVEAAHTAACKNPSPQYTQGCRPESLAALRNEIQQLSEVRRINDRKLQAKWGGELYGRIHCD